MLILCMFQMLLAGLCDISVIETPPEGRRPVNPPRAKSVVRSHHERWDGSGYPSALIGEEIPLFARIAAVADVFDAVTSARYHAAAVPPREGVEIVRAGAGSAFDPAVVEAFLAAIRP